MAAVDRHVGQEGKRLAPPKHAAALTASDLTDGTGDVAYITSYLWVPTAGDLTVITEGGETTLIAGIPAGTLIPLAITRLMSTGTTVALRTTTIGLD